MKKILTTAIILSAIALCLSGCTNQEAVNVDSDGDKYFDDEDDFPNNPEVHKKTILHEIENQKIEYYDLYEFETPIVQEIDLCKYIGWEWEVTQPTSENANVEFLVDRYNGIRFVRLYDVIDVKDANWFPVNNSYYGTWEITWFHMNEINEPVYVTGTIYAAQ